MDQSLKKLLASGFSSRKAMSNEFEIKFKHDIDYKDVQEVQEFLKQKKFRVISSSKFSQVTIFPEGYRKIDDVYEKKTRINKSRDEVHTLKLLEDQYGLKLTESTEMKYYKIPYTNKDAIMKRDRLRTTLSNKEYRCDISYMIEKKDFEMEFEMLAPKPDPSIIEDVLKIIQKGEVFPKSETKYVLSQIRQLSNGSIFPGSLPYTIKKEQITQGILACGYAMSDKSDGERVILFVDKHGQAYGIRRNRVLSKHFHCKDIKSSMFDCERIGDTFYIFDSIYMNGQSVKELTYIQRLDLITKFHPNVRKKKIYLENIKQHVSDVRNVSYETDGIIFTPIFKPYYNNQIYKWKPNNTAEFLVRRNKNGTHKLHIASETSTTDKTYTHYPFQGNDGKGTFVYKGEEIHNTMYDTQSGIINSLQDDIKNKQILDVMEEFVAEFEWKNDTWKFIKIRYDKQFANHISTINDIWNSITEPVSLQDLTESLHYNCIRKYHNAIKKQIIQEYTKEKTVLDLGLGAGGDIHKYEKAKVKHLFAIDIVEPEYKPLQKNFLTFQKVKGTAYHFSTMLPKKVDVVTSFFAVHYLFENEETIRNLCKNVRDSLKVGGRFICTFLNGTKIQESDQKDLKTNLFTIEKLDNKTIEVDIKGTKYFKFKKSKEYLVFPESFERFMEEYQLTLLEQKEFASFHNLQEHNLLSETEKQLSYLHEVMIFEKLRKNSKNKQSNKNASVVRTSLT